MHLFFLYGSNRKKIMQKFIQTLEKKEYKVPSQTPGSPIDLWEIKLFEARLNEAALPQILADLTAFPPIAKDRTAVLKGFITKIINMMLGKDQQRLTPVDLTDIRPNKSFKYDNHLDGKVLILGALKDRYKGQKEQI